MVFCDHIHLDLAAGRPLEADMHLFRAGVVQLQKRIMCAGDLPYTPCAEICVQIPNGAVADK